MRPTVLLLSTVSSTMGSKSTMRSKCTMASKSTVIIGAGIAGLATALNLPPTSVIVLDAAPGVAMGASAKNGGLLCPSLNYPWTQTSIMDLLPSAITAVDWPIKIRAPALANKDLYKFGLTWARKYHTLGNAEEAIGALMRYSLKKMDEDERLKKLVYGRGASRGTKKFNEENIVAGDGSGDIGAFCRGVAKLLLEDGVDIRTSVTASRVEVENGSVVGVTTTAGFVPCDNVVVASGTHTPKFLTPHGIDAPIYAVKGFMLSFTSSTSIDYNLMLPQKAFVAPMYDELGQKFYRGSGFAEFEGDVGNWEENKWGKGATLEGEDLRRIGKLQDIIEETFEDVEVLDRDWGYRPLTPDDVPMIGSTSVRGLWVNGGHGSKGWSMGAGSGKLLADMMLGKVGEIDSNPFCPQRFGMKQIGASGGLENRSRML